MSQTIRDLAPLIDYAKFLSTVNKVLPSLDFVTNYVKDIPSYIRIHATRPQLASFGDGLYIMGSKFEVLIGSAYLDNHPNAQYEIHNYEDPVSAESRFEASYGMDFDQYMQGSDLLNSSSVLSPPTTDEDFPLTEDLTSKMSNASDFVRRWIRTFSPKTNKAPLLIGHSGISKSAFVKEVISKLDKSSSEWGYRLVDIRAAYLDKTDLMGYISVDQYKGEDVWTDSPKSDFLTATTAFVLECRKFVTNNERSEENAHLWDTLRFYAKTPVIFYDEINRAPQYIQAQVMIMINQHRLNDYNLDIAPKLAAANVPVDMENLDDDQKELIKYVLHDEITDKAIIDRYIPITISGTDRSVIDATYTHLSEKYADSKWATLILDRIYTADKPLHDITTIDGFGKFLTHRGLDFTCQYLAGCEKNKDKALVEVIKGLLGAVATARYVYQENTNSIIQFDTTESASKFTAHNIKYNIPVMLLGRMGFGKTAKINAAVKEQDAELISIDLSSRDRTDISGFPNQYSLAQYLFKDNPDTLQSSAFRAFEAQVGQNPEVPKKTTGFVGNLALRRRIDEARASGKKLVIMFDEINRASPIVQSAVFEAISDARFMGVSLAGVDYSVVSAGNWEDPNNPSGGNYTVTPLDTATMHRFSSKVIDKMSPEDMAEFRAYTKDNFPNTYRALGFDHITDEDLLTYLNTSSDDDMDAEVGTEWARPSFSMRTFQTLNEVLEQYKFVWTQEMSVGDIEDIVATLASPNHVLHDRDGDEVEFRNAGTSKYYGNAKSIEVSKYLNKTAELLQDPKLSNADKSLILSELHWNERIAFGSLELVIRGIIPHSIVREVTPLVESFYSDNSRAALGASELGDFTAGMDDVKIVAIIRKIISRNDVTKAATAVESAIIALGNREQITVELINKILVNYKKLVPTSPISIMSVLNRIPDENLIPSNIVISVNINDLATHNDRDFFLMNRAVVIGTTVGWNTSQISDDIYANLRRVKSPFRLASAFLGTYVDTDAGKEVSKAVVVPNYFQLLPDGGRNSGNYPITLNDAVWKVSDLQGRGYPYTITYEAINKGVRLRLIVENVAMPRSYNKLPTKVEDVIQRDPNVFSGMYSMLKTLSGTSMSNIPSDILTPEIQAQIKGAEEILPTGAGVSGTRLTNDETEMTNAYIKLLGLTWGRVESKFSF